MSGAQQAGTADVAVSRQGQSIDVLRDAKDALVGMKVYSEPVRHGGVVIITASRVFGGGGGGGGEQEETGQRGQGGGFGGFAIPAGAYVIAGDGTVSWKPAHSTAGRVVGVALAAAALVGWRALGKRGR